MSTIKTVNNPMAHPGSLSWAFPDIDPAQCNSSIHLPPCLECGMLTGDLAIFRCVNSLCISKNPSRVSHIECANEVWNNDPTLFKAPTFYECPDCRGPD